MPCLSEGFRTIIEIAQHYLIADEDAIAALNEMQRFSIPVQLIGPFHSGKTTLINTMLGIQLLPTAIDQGTRIPTEISLGENGLTIHRGSHIQHAGIGDLRSGIDLHDVTRIELTYNHQVLGEIPDIKLIDTPGIDSDAPKWEENITHYFEASKAYLLIFSADEPVIKESAASILSELKLHNTPIYALLTKCDKVPAEDLVQAKTFLEGQLEKIFAHYIPLHCVSSRKPDGIEPLQDILKELQEKSNTIAQEGFTARLQAQCESLHRYLSTRLNLETLPVSELGVQLSLLESRIQQFLETLEQEEQRYHAQMSHCNNRMKEQVVTLLKNVQNPIETMLLSGQNPAGYLERMLRGGITANMLAIFIPASCNYLRQVIAALKSANLGADSSDAILAPLEPLLQLYKTLRQSNDAFVQVPELLEIKDLFEPYLKQAYRLKRQQAALRTALKEELLPTIQQTTETIIDALLEKKTREITKLVRDSVLEKQEAQRQVLEEIRAQKDDDDLRRSSQLDQMKLDIKILEDIMLSLQAQEVCI